MLLHKKQRGEFCSLAENGMQSWCQEKKFKEIKDIAFLEGTAITLHYVLDYIEKLQSDTATTTPNFSSLSAIFVFSNVCWLEWSSWIESALKGN